MNTNFLFKILLPFVFMGGKSMSAERMTGYLDLELGRRAQAFYPFVGATFSIQEKNSTVSTIAVTDEFGSVRLALTAGLYQYCAKPEGLQKMCRDIEVKAGTIANGGFNVKPEDILQGSNALLGSAGLGRCNGDYSGDGKVEVLNEAGERVAFSQLGDKFYSCNYALGGLQSGQRYFLRYSLPYKSGSLTYVETLVPREYSGFLSNVQIRNEARYIVKGILQKQGEEIALQTPAGQIVPIDFHSRFLDTVIQAIPERVQIQVSGFCSVHGNPEDTPAENAESCLGETTAVGIYSDKPR